MSQQSPTGELPANKNGKRIRIHWEYAAIAILVLLYFVVPRNTVAGTSMEPAMHNGDRFFSWRVPSNHNYQRGDIVTFESLSVTPRVLNLTFTKRVIGLPGDSVEIKDHQVSINGIPLSEPYAEWASYSLPNEQTFVISEDIQSKIPDSCVMDDCEAGTTRSWVVPDGTVFVLGDNRYGSLDSRLLGPIATDSIFSVAFWLYWPIKDAKLLN